MKIKKTLSQYIGEAIADNYLITVAITSYTQAKHVSANLPFGLGKTTIAMKLCYLLMGGNPDFNDMEIWEKVFGIMAYQPLQVTELLNPESKIRKNCMLWDDTQLTAPASSSVPIAIRKLANYISCDRPEVACIFLTCPNLNSIASPLRKLVNFEIIVSERGLFEVHKLSYYKDFNRPLQDRMHFDYVDEINRDEPFTALIPEVQNRYDAWRITQKMALYPALVKDMTTYTRLNEPGDDLGPGQIEIRGKVVRGNHGKCYIKVPDEYLGKYVSSVVDVS